YKYPQAAFPYTQLVEENRRRTRDDPEFELIDTGIFEHDRYFDITVEYAKASPRDILIRISVANRASEAAEIDVIPTWWFRNTWSWGPHDNYGRPEIRQAADLNSVPGTCSLYAQHPTLGGYLLDCRTKPYEPQLLFTENETNLRRLYGVPNTTPYVKDGINDRVVHGNKAAVNPDQKGTKVGVRYHLSVGAGQSALIELRMHHHPHLGGPRSDRPWNDFEALFARRAAEADAYYHELQPGNLSEDLRRIQRQALAGMLWSKQFYHYDVRRWLKGDPYQPAPPPERLHGRNSTWKNINTASILSMPDAWEYPWFAAWDLAFHCVVLALVDSDFAKEQLNLMGREWFQHA
ncbi:MAG TPA: hypothetical protein VFT99_11165, partial [Roseiflexaceae bacterium]|nr:hypothetical protein [Roseiflexaceae bacterium]